MCPADRRPLADSEVQDRSAAGEHTVEGGRHNGVMSLKASYHFEIDDLWVEGALLGRKEPIMRDGRRCWLQFPSDDDDFGIGKSSFPLDPIGASSGTVDEPRQRVAVRVVRVEVEIDTGLTAADIPPRGPTKRQH